jgi:hypothetical protein
MDERTQADVTSLKKSRAGATNLEAQLEPESLPSEPPPDRLIDPERNPNPNSNTPSF